MELFERYPFLIELLIFGLGSFASLIFCYMKFYVDIHYIKDQLAEILKKQTGMSDLYSKYAILDKEIDGVHIRLNYLEKHFNGGNSYGTSS